MTPHDQSKDLVELFRLLQVSSLPDEEAIDAMTPEQVAQCLADAGIDPAKLQLKIAERKKKLAGMFALMRAHQARTAPQASVPAVAVPGTREAIIAYFEQRYGQEMPMAARNYRSASYEELKQLFLDLHQP